MTKIVISEEALHEMVREALNSTGWSGEGNSSAVNVNPITDPSCSVTDPINPDYTPQDKTEFGVAVGRLVRNLPDSDMPAVYTAVKKALDQRTEKEEINDAEEAAMLGGSQEAIDANGGVGKDEKHHEGKMPTDNKIEEQLRLRIRKIIAEMRGTRVLDEAPEVKKIPAGVHGAEYMRRMEKTRKDLRKTLGHAADTLDAPEPEDDSTSDEDEGGEESQPKRRHAYKPSAIGGMGDVQGKSFEEIAKEMGMSVAGAKQLVDKALMRLQFYHGKMDETERKLFMASVLNGFKDEVIRGKIELSPEDREKLMVGSYINMLKSSGELTAADVQLLQDHPDIVKDLDGFKEYVSSKPGDEDKLDIVSLLKSDAVTDLDSFREFFSKSLKKRQKGEETKLEDPLGEADGELDEDDNGPPPGEIKMTSIASKHPEAKPSSSPPKSAPPTKARGASGSDIEVDWGGFNENKLSKSPILAEVAAIVQQDSKGPYVIADGVEARPASPNRTQYKAGSKINVFRSGKKGVFIVEMPNGERWTNKLAETSHGGVAVKVRKHKEAHPDLYCPKCLWRTNGGPCPSHGGPATPQEREQMQQDLGSHVHDPGAVADWMAKRKGL